MGWLRRRDRDPSPSIWAYRMHRLWLTPAFHRVLRVGLPLVAVTCAGVWYFADGTRIAAIREMAQEAQRSFQERPEFMVQMLAVDGASDPLSDAVREILPVNLPTSSFDLDLGALKAEVETLDAVASVQIRVRPGGILTVEITERVPAVLWRGPQGLKLLDAAGHRVAQATSRLAFPDLSVIAGEGAERAVPEALELLAAAEPISERIRGLERIGARRWDIVLDRRQRIQLPEADAVNALERLIALHDAREILDRDVSRVDLRNPYRPTLRLNGTAMAELHRIRNLEATGTYP